MKKVLLVAALLSFAPSCFAQLTQEQKLTDFKALVALYDKNYQGNYGRTQSECVYFPMMLGYKSHNHNNVVYSGKYQVVWCPKYRRKVLAGGVEKRLLELIHEAAARYRAES